MRSKIFLLILSVTITFYAQNDVQLTFDELKGNYIIEYQGYLHNEDEQKTTIRRIFEPSNKVLCSIQAIVTYELFEKNYDYEYTLFNDKNSLQRLQSFDLEVESPLTNIEKPDSNWRSAFFSYLPVFGWFHSKGIGGLSHPFDGIAPDSSMAGFAFKSSGLPSIKKAYFTGKVKIILSFPDEPPNEVYELLKPLRQFPNNSFVNYTIAPQDPPVPFINNEFIDSLKNMIFQSHDLGWIKNQSTFDKYNEYLADAKDAFEQNDTILTQLKMDQVIGSAVLDSSSSITSEAFALLYYNTKYVLDQFPEFTLLNVYDRLIQAIDDFRNSGDIKNNGIYNGLSQKVKNSKRKYEQEKYRAALNIMNAFQNELEAQLDNHITDNCYQGTNIFSQFITKELMKIDD